MSVHEFGNCNDLEPRTEIICDGCGIPLPRYAPEWVGGSHYCEDCVKPTCSQCGEAINPDDGDLCENCELDLEREYAAAEEMEEQP